MLDGGSSANSEWRGPGWRSLHVRPLAREVALITAAILAYFGVRNLTAGNVDPAFDNAERIYDLEQDLGIAWEDELQDVVLEHDRLVDVANWVYIWGHWPVVLGSALALFLLRRDRYVLLRNALFVSGAIGFLFFALFPVAPPRLLDLGLVDTVTERSDAYRALQPPGLTNQYAAFPSLHAGWNLLVGIVLVLAFSHVAVRAFAVAMPVAMALAVVMTANHFVLDVPAGAAVVLVGLAAALALEARRGATSTLGEDAASSEVAAGDGSARRAATRGRAPRR